MKLAASLVVVLCATSVMSAARRPTPNPLTIPEPPALPSTTPPTDYCQGKIIAPINANYKNFACGVSFHLHNGRCNATLIGRWLSDDFFGKWKEKCRRKNTTVDCFCTTRKCNEDVSLMEQQFNKLRNKESRLKKHVQPCLDSLRAILPTNPKDSSPKPTRIQKGNTESMEGKEKSTTARPDVVIPGNGDAATTSHSDGQSSKPKSTTSNGQIELEQGETTEEPSTDTKGSEGSVNTDNPDDPLPGSAAITTVSGEEPNPESWTTTEELTTETTIASDDNGEDVTSTEGTTKSADEPRNGGEIEAGQAEGTTEGQFSTGIPTTGETTTKTTTAELAVVPAEPRADEGTGADQVTEETSSEKVKSDGGGTPAWLIVVIIIIVVLCVGLIIGGYILYKDKWEKKEDVDKNKKTDEEKGLGVRPADVPRVARVPVRPIRGPGRARRVPIVYDEQDRQAILDGRIIPLDILSERRFTNMGPLHMKAPKMETLEKTGPLQSSRSLKDGPIEFDDAGNQIFMMGSSIEIIDESEKEAATQESSKKEKSKKEASRVDASRNTSKKESSKMEVSKTQPSSKKDRSMPTQPSASKKSDKKEPAKDNVKEEPAMKKQ